MVSKFTLIILSPRIMYIYVDVSGHVWYGEVRNF